jgi:hypothetical protein
MALGLIRGLAQPFVKELAIKGFSANEALRILQSVGLGYRRADFLLDYRTYLRIPGLSEVLKFIPKSYRVSKEHFIEPKTHMARKYAYEVKFKILKPETGETFDFYNRVSSDSNLPRGKIEEEATKVISSAMDRSKFIIEGGYLFAAYHNPEEEW